MTLPFPQPRDAYPSVFTGRERPIQGELKRAVERPLHPSVRKTGALDRRHLAAKLVLDPHLAYIVGRSVVGHLECRNHESRSEFPWTDLHNLEVTPLVRNGSEGMDAQLRGNVQSRVITAG